MKGQKELVLEYMMRHGGITAREAASDLGIYRLSARIWELRRDGHDIRATIQEEVNRYGITTHFARYRLGAGQ